MSGKIVPNALKLLAKSFGKVKNPPLPRDRAFEIFQSPKRLARPLALQNKETEQVQLGMAFHGLPLGHADLPAANLFATILGGTMSSRLFIQVRERRGLCYSIHASHQALEDTGIFAVMAGLDKKRVREAVKTIFEELKKAKVSGVTPDELRRAKDHIRGRLTLAFEDSSFQADWYGRQWMFKKELETPEERMRRLDRVTVKDVKRVARALIRPEIMASAVIGPFSSKRELAKMFDWK